MEPLYMRQTEDEEGTITVTRWGYCRLQNAVRLGYTINILAALLGLILVFTGHLKLGIPVVVFVGASFACSYFSEQMLGGFNRGFVVGVGIACSVSAYIWALMGI